MTKNQTLITAAGGNGTAIEILDQALSVRNTSLAVKRLRVTLLLMMLSRSGF